MPKPTISKLKKKLDALFSQYIRLRQADDDGMVTCVTCNKVAHWKDNMQCGHYISRSKLSTRFDERNCNVQCIGCNVFKSGNMVEYTIYMQKEYGDHIVIELSDLGKKTVKLDREWYEDKIAHYKSEVARLMK